MSLKQNVLSIFDSALSSANAYEAVIKAGRFFDHIEEKNIYAIAIGKAAMPMAAAVDKFLKQRLTKGLIAGVLSDRFILSDKWTQYNGGHPMPDNNSFEAGSAALDLLNKADRGDAAVIFLISGGGSAMIEKGFGGVTKKEIIDANKKLVGCGADIADINNIRKIFSGVKGGKLADAARSARQITLIISDTEPDDEANVASGPSITSIPDQVSAIKTIKKYALDDQLSPNIIDLIESFDQNADKLKTPINSEIVTILDNRHSLQAASVHAKALGFEVFVLNDLRQTAVIDGVEQILVEGIEKLRQDPDKAICILSGGEFSCPVRGSGIGGRNTEAVLRMAIELDKRKNELGEAFFLSAGTDGLDGNSPAAGAVCDVHTIERASEQGLEATQYLKNSDSFTFFEELGDAVLTGSTLTNVRDVRILLIKR